MSDDRNGPGPMNHGDYVKCELRGCQSTGHHKITVGKFMVFDGDTPTMTRPAEMCQACVNYAKQCGMSVRKR